NQYLSDAAFFEKGKLADICMITSPDRLHRRHAEFALKAGYDILLEKPIACTEEDCQAIYNLAKKLGRQISVCHVLRYAPFFRAIKDELCTDRYGKIVTVNLTENVGFLHQAHSFVRGNWSVTEKSCPMIVAKCCHDLDLLSWIIGKRCKSVSSFGGLSYFVSRNAPENSAERCLDCAVKEQCIYNAEKFYVTDRFDQGVTGWPVDVIAPDPTKEKVYQALRTGPYGRCVYRCDNTAVDHQVVNMEFEEGVTAHLTMTPFAMDAGRDIHVHCERGDILGTMEKGLLHCNIFGGERKTIRCDDAGYGHGGGDYFLIKDLIDIHSNKNALRLTDIGNSLQSHMMGFAAEKSRINGGKVFTLD
ncbi:MAG: Gfo/Idh/MocA family oxidoreductase, partial [Firmicutes bacterium]|nr:Gfo/Idh/MocA family oxidoreductase [Bacillota bacterium]